MATEKLVKVRLIGLQKEKGEVLDFLQEEGFMHLCPVERLSNEHGLSRDTPLKAMEEVSQALLELRWAEEQLRPYAKKARTHPFSEMTVQQALRQVKELKARYHKRLAATVKEQEALAAERKTLSERRAVLDRIPFRIGASPLVSEGSLVFSWIVEEPEDSSADLRGLLEGFIVHTVNKGRFHVVQGLIKDKEGIERALKQASLFRVDVPPLKTTRRKEVASLRRRIERIDQQQERHVEVLTRLAKRYFADVRQAQFVMEIFHDRYEATTAALRTKATFVIEGYVPVKRMRDLRHIMKRARVHIEELPLDEAPSKLHNWPYVRHFEFITRMFGLPRYGNVDPTVFISVFLPLFFGFMFSDVGYGLFLLMGALYLLARSHAGIPILRDAGIVLSVNAIMTILFGWLLGSFFGDLVPIQPLAGAVIAGFDSFKSALSILMAALALGLLHLNLGILVSIIEHLRQKQFKEFVLGDVAMLCLEGGAVFLALGFKSPGFYLLAVSLALLVRRAGVMGIMDIVGFVGTWFSYARLLALSLATGGIALSVNIIGRQVGELAWAGPVLLVIILLLGHMFNFALNVLGSSINSVRLHYIEFFSRFYEGGGKPFKAFDTKRVKDSS